MRKHFLVFILLFFPVLLLAMEGRLMRYPDIHGDKIVFTYEDDLWLVSSKGGVATRITSHPGRELLAKFSPDGNWIAFTGNYDGGTDVYLIPVGGGEPKRLSYHPGADYVVDWTPDGKFVLFRSRREDPTGRYSYLYKVSIKGGYPEKLNLDKVRYASFSPDGKRVALNRYTSDRMNWKGYRGGAQQDIWIADIEKGTFEKVTKWQGYDIFPMWYQDRVYFASDRQDGRMNLYYYSLRNKKITRCTFYKDWDVEFPSIGGDKIVYGCQGYLWTYDIKTGDYNKLPIQIPSDRWRTRATYIDPSEFAQEITLSQKGDTAVVQARGDVYILDTEEGTAVNITNTSGSREIYPTLSPDGKWVAFYSDKTGEYELYITKPKPGGKWIQLTKDSHTYYYHPVWAPDSKKLVFGDKDFKLYYVDIVKRKFVTVDHCLYQKDNEIYWEISEYDWSPDSKWIVYSKVEENMNSSIFLYNIETKKITRITDDRYDDHCPAFDKNGQYLYFLSLRNFEPELDPFMDNNINANMSKVMLVQLQAGREPPFEESEETTKTKSSEIDLKGIQKRIFPVPVKPGTYKSLQASKDKIFFLSKKRFGFPGWEEFIHPKAVKSYTLKSFDIKKRKTSTIIEGIGYYNLSYNGKKAAYRSGKTFGVIPTKKKGSVGDGKLKWGGVQQKVNTLKEYSQMFAEVWRQIRDFFYDPELHGKDWKAIQEKYEPLIKYVGNHSDLNYLMGQMIGELIASHEYIFGGPSDRKFKRVSVGLLGADLEPDKKTGYYRFKHILAGENWDKRLTNPLLAPTIKIKVGDYLLAIDGHPVKAEENYLKYLVDKAGKEVTITVNDKPDFKTAKTYRIKTLKSDRRLRYHEWVENNYRKVKEATGGRVGYIHLIDMNERGIQQFEQGFRAERFREGLIIDVRENGGGFVSWFLIDKLERRLLYLTKTRDFKPMRYPHGTHFGPIVVICNAGTGSDGEIFTQHFKDLKLGTVIGTPTWGGLIGIINMLPLVDGTIVTQSNVGFCNLKGEWVVENKGVQPDIYVENNPAEIIKGRDQQLEKAIEVVMEQLKERAGKIPSPPPFPKK